MKQHLNTLFVTTQGAYLAKDGEAVAVRVDSETKLRFPAHTLDGVICFGQVSMSPALMAHLAEKDVCVSFLSESGRFLARVQGPTHGNVLLRRRQYRAADDPATSADIARMTLAGKLHNCRAALRRSARDHPDRPEAEKLSIAADALGHQLKRLPMTNGLEGLRGLEGEAAAGYFGAFAAMLLRGEPELGFTGRNRRPPLDPVNCLLSFLYTLLVHDVRSALESVGLDPQVGFLHRDRPGRPSLALDLMEEFRPVLADRLALTLLNRGMLDPKDFRTAVSGAVSLTDKARKTVITAWQERKRNEVEHPFLREKMAAGLLPFAQALLLARFLRGDLDAYPPYLWR
ncbi:CRISPR-associated protein Cas1 [Alkalidesulfovibrio alkalitolerans DSM 16529]|uniref:CRISPR-associated endonuclease Cas1 n=1 Tax=Alkalidesulfovibrio alkalitolerans DSM 16529 TaxID=1121439 RepID=S7TAH3_9BACT|nr:type I-C CRISPR-associated endonuclease Cas1c [Alkalidesulfovibrio alkalitolerans]EPR34122.1 CRISPR-associated protein Cas1 [Alkalidesulfovibrio alkalitolerans DSM 16529]